jgi:hypothetical protein
MNRLLIYTCERVASILHYLIACAPAALYVSLGFLMNCGIYTSLVSCSLGFGVNSHLTTGCVRIVDFFAATRTHTWVTYGFYLSQMEMFHFHYYWHEHYLSLCREYIIKVNKKWIYCARTEINFYPFPLVWRENQTPDRKNWATPAQSEVLSCLVCHSPQRRDEQVAYAPRMNRTSESGLRVLEAWWERYRYLLSDRGTSRAGHVNYFASQLCQIAHTHTHSPEWAEYLIHTRVVCVLCAPSTYTISNGHFMAGLVMKLTALGIRLNLFTALGIWLINTVIHSDRDEDEIN